MDSEPGVQMRLQMVYDVLMFRENTRRRTEASIRQLARAALGHLIAEGALPPERNLDEQEEQEPAGAARKRRRVSV